MGRPCVSLKLKTNFAKLEILLRMKKYLLFAAVATMTLFASCTKEGPRVFTGNYSFKTSGTLTLQADTSATAPLFTAKLVTEQGQMDIVGTSDDEVAITMNISGGALVILDATAKADSLVLASQKRNISVIFNDTQSESDNPLISLGDKVPSGTSATATVEGVAKRYSDIILFDLKYSGTITKDDITYNIVDSNISSRAKLNK